MTDYVEFDKKMWEYCPIKLNELNVQYPPRLVTNIKHSRKNRRYYLNQFFANGLQHSSGEIDIPEHFYTFLYSYDYVFPSKSDIEVIYEIVNKEDINFSFSSSEDECAMRIIDIICNRNVKI